MIKSLADYAILWKSFLVDLLMKTLLVKLYLVLCFITFHMLCIGHMLMQTLENNLTSYNLNFSYLTILSF